MTVSDLPAPKSVVDLDRDAAFDNLLDRFRQAESIVLHQLSVIIVAVMIVASAGLSDIIRRIVPTALNDVSEIIVVVGGIAAIAYAVFDVLRRNRTARELLHAHATAVTLSRFSERV